MRKHFHLPLLAALPALLAACDDRPDLDGYSRARYNTAADCQRAYRAQLAGGLQNPCQKSSAGSRVSYFGPYMYNDGSSTRYVGYTSSGAVASSGLTYNSKKGSYSGFKSPGVSRGGLTTSGRAASSSVGS